MITVCLVVAGVLQCATVAGPRPTPAAAAAILTPGQYVALPDLPTGPQVTVIASSVPAGPFGNFTPYERPRPLNQTPHAYEPMIAYGTPLLRVQVERPGARR